MFYTEWLRVRNCLRITVIILAIAFLIAVCVRIAAAVAMHQAYGWIDTEEHKPGVHVSTVREADGTLRTTVDDRRDDVHIVIDDHGWYGKSITATGRGVNSDNGGVQIGSLGVQSRGHGANGEVIINTNIGIPAEVLLFFSAWVGLIVGTVLCGPMAKENANHLEIAWTKPISREQLALGMMGVDAVGILLSMAMTTACMLLSTALFEFPTVTVSSHTLPVLALCVVVPLAWYALLTVASTSLKRGRGAVIGLGWFAALVTPGIALGLSAVDLQPFHAIGIALGYLTMLNPIAYMHVNLGNVGDSDFRSAGYNFGILSSGPGVRAAAAALLCIVYTAFSLIQWRRLEA